MGSTAGIRFLVEAGIIVPQTGSRTQFAFYIMERSGLKTEINGSENLLRCSRNIIYPQNLALTSPTRGGRLFGIVRLRTKVTELSSVHNGWERPLPRKKKKPNFELTTVPLLVSKLRIYVFISTLPHIFITCLSVAITSHLHFNIIFPCTCKGGTMYRSWLRHYATKPEGRGFDS
jgi:hypothetical protein